MTSKVGWKHYPLAGSSKIVMQEGGREAAEAASEVGVEPGPEVCVAVVLLLSTGEHPLLLPAKRKFKIF